MINSYAHAADVTISWPPPESGGEVGGYMVYWRTANGSYSDFNGLNAESKTSVTLSFPDDGGDYYFIVRAYNAAGMGPVSNEVFWSSIDTIPPVLTNVEYSITEYSVTINGESEVGATLYFDVNESLYSQVSLSESEWTVTYSEEGNIPSDYVFEIIAVDSAGNESEPFTYIYEPPYDNTQNDDSDTVEESADSKGGGCFIATAAYVSLFKSYAKILIEFWDSF